MKTANLLVKETSTYLKQHAYNPVQWYPWGAEALDRAKAEQKPILLSVGYAACHWCHVMEHESFEDQATADIMNANFINIKVDREERTDIDEIYMKAVQIMTGHGGWPMTVFLTPELKPFFGGTYFPKEDRHGMPAFKRVLTQINKAWLQNREDLMASAGELTEHLRLMEKVKADGAQTIDGESYLNYGTISSALEKFYSNFDADFGGFGGAPKFPHTFALELFMRSTSKSSEIKDSKKEECLEVINTSLDKMACGGIYDHLAGGFARYSVDRKWLVPHFEKMLYDNALLARTYFDGYLITGKNFWLATAEGILRFVKNELETQDGGFYSSLDADSEGEEGKFYVFKREEVKSILGKDGAWLADVYGVTESGNFEHGNSVLHLSKEPAKLASDLGMSEAEFLTKLEKLSAVLLAAREKRIRPGRDEKVLTSWNSLMVSAYVQGYQVTGKETYLQTGKRAMQFILDKLYVNGRLLRVWGVPADQVESGHAKLDAYLDDYAYAINALLDLASVDRSSVWLNTATKLADTMLTLFNDCPDGGFYYTAKDAEQMIVRTRSHFDGSVPSGTSSATMALLRLAYLTGITTYDQAAQKVLQLYGPNLTRLCDQFANLLNCLDFRLSAPREIAVLQPDSLPQEVAQKSVLNLFKRYSPNKVVAQINDSSANEMPGQLFKERTSLDNKSTFYICRNFACQKPISEEAELLTEMQNW
ncbi:MAG: thioredoxin domain-containing protein [Candidatus Obscuribacter sp.]|nr:thioredoxin domain-containing protein [Candidatus Obscuribacter sp.]